ncbi:hypothetical protein GC167_09205 [bacterium]|nr:hypothetical protein [bacterium]
MGILERLKTETAELHRQTEEYSYGDLIMSGRLTKAQYADLIDKNAAVHHHYESILIQIEGLDALFEGQLHRRIKLSALESDKAVLHYPSRSFTPIEHRPADVAEALGALYVLEGSSLGGAVIARALSKIPEIAETGAFAFYTFYGAELGAQWKAFGQIVVNFVEHHGQADRLVESAKRTFESVKSVFSTALEPVA